MPEVDEIIKIQRAVAEFAEQMQAKMLEKFLEDGFREWDNPNNLSNTLEFLKDHVDRQVSRSQHQEIDIANLAMIIWYQYRVKKQRSEDLDKRCEEEFQRKIT